MTAPTLRALLLSAATALALTSAPGSAQPATGAKAAPGASREDETYRRLELFARVLSYVENNYVQEPDEQKLVYGAIKGMLETLDPHTVFMPPELFKQMRIDTTGEFGGLGVEIAREGDTIKVVAPIDDTPASRAGILAGDEILAIDGETIRGFDVSEVVRRMQGAAGTRVRLSISRSGFTAPRDIDVVRDYIRIVSVKGALYGSGGQGIAHVKVKNFQERTDHHLRKELDRLRNLNGGKELRGLVLDLRNNPGGLLDQAIAVSDRFLGEDLVIVSTQGRNGRNATQERAKARGTESNYPIVVLVNAGSASASEIVAGALQDHRRAVVMGTQTFGKGSVQTVIELEDGSGLKLTIARYYTPKGRSIQELGITPDFLIAEAQQKPAVVTREKDLVRHLANPVVQPASATTPRPVPLLESFPPASELKDVQLKTALDYVFTQRK